VVGHTGNTFGAGRILTLPIKRIALRQVELMDLPVAPVTIGMERQKKKNGLSLLGPLIENIWKLKDCCHRWKYHTPNSILGEEKWAVRLANHCSETYVKLRTGQKICKALRSPSAR
jgi:hypothetical protein